ncbi:MAG: hypothetical protein V8T12_09515 [Parabacteroides johnsonii]
MRTLKNERTITADVVGTYINTDMDRFYTETEDDKPFQMSSPMLPERNIP